MREGRREGRRYKTWWLAQLADPHVFDNGEDEGGSAADACVVEGIILDADLLDGLKFMGLVDGFL